MIIRQPAVGRLLRQTPLGSVIITVLRHKVTRPDYHQGIKMAASTVTLRLSWFKVIS